MRHTNLCQQWTLSKWKNSALIGKIGTCILKKPIPSYALHLSQQYSVDQNKSQKARTPLSNACNYHRSSTREQHILEFEKEMTQNCSFSILSPLPLLLFHCKKIMNANTPRLLVPQQSLNVREMPSQSKLTNQKEATQKIIAIKKL